MGVNRALDKNPSELHSFVCSFAHPFVHSSIHSFVHSFFTSFIDPSIHQSFRPSIHLSIRTYIHILTYTYINIHVHTYTYNTYTNIHIHSLVRSCTHSLIHPSVRPSISFFVHSFIRLIEISPKPYRFTRVHAILARHLGAPGPLTEGPVVVRVQIPSRDSSVRVTRRMTGSNGWMASPGGMIRSNLPYRFSSRNHVVGQHPREGQVRIPLCAVSPRLSSFAGGATKIIPRSNDSASSTRKGRHGRARPRSSIARHAEHG